MRPALFLALVLTVPVRAQSPAAAGLSTTEWRAANVFFSNFAEAGVAPFERGAVPDETLIAFGVAHTWINAPQRVGRTGDRGRLSTAAVDAAAVRYFGQPVGRHRSPGGGVRLERGAYTFPLADGEVPPFAQVVRWTPAAGGEAVARVTVFAGEETDRDLYGTPAADLRRAGADAAPLGQMDARVREVCEAGRCRYVLLAWRPAR